jgi:light-regulated signal transduction histidine kinase (bacteriophytochrome)
VRTVARELTGADGAAFIIRSGNNCYYADEDAIGPLWKGRYFPMTQCVSGWAMMNHKTVVIEDVFADDRIPADAYSPTFVKSLVMAPIREADPIGAIGNYWAQKRMPGEHEVKLLQALASLTAVTLENIKIYNELENRVKDRTEELVATNKTLEAFAYSVSHDLRAPLRNIKQYTGVIFEDYATGLQPGAEQVLKKIDGKAAETIQMIDDMLAFFSASKKETNKSLVQMYELVEAICAGVQDRETGRSIRFIIHDMPLVRADGNLLNAVWENLVSNAVKFSSKKPEALVEIGCNDKDGLLIFYIKDNGAGFDMRYYHKLFGTFQRLHSKDEFEGNGIGLAIVERIINRHGGTVWAESGPGEGSCFYFSLPKG